VGGGGGAGGPGPLGPRGWGLWGGGGGGGGGGAPRPAKTAAKTMRRPGGGGAGPGLDAAAEAGRQAGKEAAELLVLLRTHLRHALVERQVSAGPPSSAGRVVGQPCSSSSLPPTPASTCLTCACPHLHSQERRLTFASSASDPATGQRTAPAKLKSIEAEVTGYLDDFFPAGTSVEVFEESRILSRMRDAHLLHWKQLSVKKSGPLG
jgi:hypothetical protein